MSIYTRELYALIIEKSNGKLFLLDNCSVLPACAGNYIGLLIHFDHSLTYSCQCLCEWFWRRVLNTGVLSLFLLQVMILYSHGLDWCSNP